MAHFVLDTIQIPCIETLERINNNKNVLKLTPAAVEIRNHRPPQHKDLAIQSEKKVKRHFSGETASQGWIREDWLPSQSYYNYLPFLRPNCLSQEVSTPSQPTLMTAAKKPISLHLFEEELACLQAKTGATRQQRGSKGESWDHSLMGTPNGSLSYEYFWVQTDFQSCFGGLSPKSPI